MSLAPGTKLGPYEIQSPLAAGGMGEVYRARDTRLEREVAIKILPESFARDADRLRRFEQEARAVAALNHPNIVSVHDIGTQDGIPYIVTELLEGRTLREQLNEAAGPLRKAVEYARLISHGLAGAHSRGIIHRDLKPENVFCTKDGRVKILDFGLAKQNPPNAASAETMGGATVSDVHTQPGMVMGTVGYMSPEQVRGTAADHRSDIFSLGAILYEMLSGQRAFRRDTTAETMTAILKEEPPELTGTNPTVSPGVDRIARRCLEKEPAQRFQSAADLGFALEALSGTTSSSVAPAQTSRTAKWRPAAAAAVLVLAALIAGWFARGAVIPRISSPVFNQITYRRGTVFSARLSPDGKTVVYSASWDGGPVQIYAVDKASPESRSLDVKGGILLSINSPGDLAILTDTVPLDHYEFEGTLSTMPMGGGAPRELLQNVTAADWAPDGQSLAVVHVVGGKYVLEYPIGKTLFETTGSITQPRVSRDGKMVAFLQHPQLGDDRGSVMVVDQNAKARVLSDGWGAEQGLAWSPAGDEVLFSAVQIGSIFSVHAASLSGKTRDVLAGPGGIRFFDATPDGRLLVSHNETRYAVAASIDGAQQRDLSWLDSSFQPNLSKEGKRILFGEGSGPAGTFYAVCLRGTDGSPVVRLGDGLPYALSPDGAWAWALLEKSPPQVELLPTGPGEERHPTNANIENYLAMGWMPDSQSFIFAGNEPGHGDRFYLQDIHGGAARPLTREGLSANAFIAISADGKRFAALDQNSRAWNLCGVEDGKCAPFPGSREGDLPLQWSADGKYIYAGRGQLTQDLWRIDLATGQGQLWKKTVLADPVGTNKVLVDSVTPDGKSFAISYTRNLDQLYLVDAVH
jgi:eukaryotic-like serine/threonine-protein kinase